MAVESTYMLYVLSFIIRENAPPKDKEIDRVQSRLDDHLSLG